MRFSEEAFSVQYRSYFDLVERALAEIAPALTNPGDTDSECVLGSSMRYSLLGGGKRIRPILALAACELVGGDPCRIAVPAAGLECIHTYSLIHDDLPCMDDDDMRRDKPSNHKVFGETIALLAGDALLTYAFEVLARPLDVPGERHLQVLRETAEAIGWRGMVQGQVLDTLGTGKGTVTAGLAGLERIHALKTGRLIVASARLGALLGPATEEELDQITRYAVQIGLAFQIKDDLLDVVGESSKLGKKSGSDARNQKTTYVSLLGVEEAHRHLRQTIGKAKEAVACLGDRAYFLCALADFIGGRDH